MPVTCVRCSRVVKGSSYLQCMTCASHFCFECMKPSPFPRPMECNPIIYEENRRSSSSATMASNIKQECNEIAVKIKQEIYDDAVNVKEEPKDDYPVYKPAPPLPTAHCPECESPMSSCAINKINALIDAKLAPSSQFMINLRQSLMEEMSGVFVQVCADVKKEEPSDEEQ